MQNRSRSWIAVLSDGVDGIARVACVGAGTVFILVLVVQVFIRYVSQGAMSWYVDAVTLAFKWSLFMGVAIAYRNRSHIVLPFIADRLPTRLQKVLLLAVHLTSLVFFVFLVWGGWRFLDQIKVVDMPVLGISEFWAALSLPVAAMFMCVHAARFTFESAREFSGNYSGEGT